MNEKDKPTLFRWLQALGCILNEQKKFFCQEIFTLKVDVKKDIYSIKRLNRQHDDNEYVILRIFPAMVNQFQTLDSTEVVSYLNL